MLSLQECRAAIEAIRAEAREARSKWSENGGPPKEPAARASFRAERERVYRRIDRMERIADRAETVMDRSDHDAEFNAAGILLGADPGFTRLGTETRWRLLCFHAWRALTEEERSEWADFSDYAWSRADENPWRSYDLPATELEARAGGAEADPEAAGEVLEPREAAPDFALTPPPAEIRRAA